MGNICECNRQASESNEFNLLSQPLMKGHPTVSILPKTFEIPHIFQAKISKLPDVPTPTTPYIFDENYYQLPDKKIYQGTWDKNGKAIGYGKLYYLDQGFYEGFLEDFEPKGNGRYITLTNEIYEGKFDGLKKMQGLLINDEGIKVSGTFIDWTTEGNGEELWTDKTTFIGNYINGQKNGLGKMAWFDEKGKFLESYEGEFRNNNFNGRGVYIWGNKKKYDGEWKDGKMNGKGVFTWKDGRSYIGEFKEDLKDGYGEFKWNDGRIWKGNWLGGQKIGIGYSKDCGGVEQVGEWKNDKRVRWLSKEEIEERKKKKNN